MFVKGRGKQPRGLPLTPTAKELSYSESPPRGHLPLCAQVSNPPPPPCNKSRNRGAAGSSRCRFRELPKRASQTRGR